MTDHDFKFMEVALDQAYVGLEEGEFPVGCVIVYEGQIIGTGRNSRYLSKVKHAHAEMNAISGIANFLHDHPRQCDIYVTLEPCLMCFGTIICNRFSRLIFGATDHNAGGTAIKHLPPHFRDRSPKIVSGILATRCLELVRLYSEAHNATWVKSYFRF